VRTAIDLFPAGRVYVIRVVVVDDEALVRSGFRLILNAAPDIEVVAATTGGEALDAVLEHRPDVVLVDIRMPDVDGLTVLSRLRDLPDSPAVAMLTTFDADEYVLRALRAGASGFLLKDTAPVDILHAVRRVAHGDAMLSPAVTRRLIAHVAAPAAAPRTAARRRLDGLSERERDVALALGEGKSNAEISAELFMSVATVKAHVSRLLTKLELNNRVQVALLVHDAGLA
jgi:DNA-binding NarL/FixJ family response regulator